MAPSRSQKGTAMSLCEITITNSTLVRFGKGGFISISRPNSSQSFNGLSPKVKQCELPIEVIVTNSGPC